MIELTCTNLDATLTVYPAASAGKEGFVSDKNVIVISAFTAYLPEDESGGYRLTDGRGYISSKQAKEKGWNITSVPCSEVRLKSLVGQCEQWMRAHLPYRPVRFHLLGPGPVELKVDLHGVRHVNNYD